MAQQDSSFERTPLPSAPAGSTITKLQIALNNLIAQVTEAVYFVAESAPPASSSSLPDDDGSKRTTEQEIMTRGSQIASAILAVREMSDKLPDSSRQPEYYEKRVDMIQTESAKVTEQLRSASMKAGVINNILKKKIRKLAEDLANENP